MTTLHIDFETRSTLDLPNVGLYNYARHPTTDVWCMAGALGGVESLIWTPDGSNGNYQLVEWQQHVAEGGKVMAHNAPFELAIWNNIMVPRYGWPELRPEQTYCTMAMAYAMGLPGKLEDAALALGLRFLKDAGGHALMLRMARPRSYNADGSPVWWKDPDKLNRLYEYCKQDVRVERALEDRLVPLSAKERKVWLMDYKINQTGVAADVETAHAAVALTDQVKERCNSQLATLTNGAVLTVTAVAAFKDWMKANGVATESVAKDIVEKLLEGELPVDVRRALVLRQEAGKASTAKLGRMVANVGPDGRLRNMYQYHGAGPGRWAGRAVQTHNLPRDMPKARVVEEILELVRAQEYDTIDMVYGPPMTMISKCLRSFFAAPAGKYLVSGDFANVEGRGQAWFAGEDWKIKAYKAADAGTGPGLYELAFSRMFNVPVESVINPSEERQIGKVSELAFGYQGGVGSFHTMAKSYKVNVSDEQADEFKNAWRDAHPAIAGVPYWHEKRQQYFRSGGIWKAVQEAAISAVQNPGEKFRCGHPDRQATYRMVGSFLWCLLPSGRTICYPYPKILQGEYGPQLTYMTVPGVNAKASGKIIDDPSNASNWARTTTYGGTLFNNIVQGFCRDLLADKMLELTDKGAKVVLHTHDDINIEVDSSKSKGAAAAMQGIMCTAPAWAAGFPLTAECSIMKRYGK